LRISSLVATTPSRTLDILDPIDPVTELTERLVNTALDDLEATRALQRSNCTMDVAELLNPAAEISRGQVSNGAEATAK
jgi:hypothetical protein